MTIESMALGAEIVSGIVVATTLLILVFQMRQNARREEVDAVKEGVEDFVRAVVAATATKENADVVIAGAHGLEGLSRSEQARFHSIMLNLIAGFDQIHTLYSNNLLDDAHFLAAQRTYISFLKMPGAQQWWSVFKHNPPEPLVAHIDKVAADPVMAIQGAHEVIPWLAARSST